MYYNGLYDESPFSITHRDPDLDPDLDPEDDYEDDDLAEDLEEDDDSDPTDPANTSLYFLLREEEGDLF